MASQTYVLCSNREVSFELREVLFKSPSVHVSTHKPHGIRDLWSYVPDEGGIPILAAAYALVPTPSCGPLKGVGIGR